jgi:hypothetical protein
MRLARRTMIQAIVLTVVSAGLVSAHTPGPVRTNEAAAVEAAETAGPGQPFTLENDCPLASKASLPVSLEASLPGPTKPAMRPIGDCEKALANCMNKGGDPDACWNAYWRCSG